jgi:hypothetical protein
VNLGKTPKKRAYKEDKFVKIATMEMQIHCFLKKEKKQRLQYTAGRPYITFQKNCTTK